MGCRVLHDMSQGKAALYDSVTDTAFGPLFDDCENGCCVAAEIADEFCIWLRVTHAKDPRELSDSALVHDVGSFLTHRKCPARVAS